MSNKAFFKYVIFLGLSICQHSILKSQTVLYIDDIFKLKIGDTISVNGYMLTESKANVDNGGVISISDSLVNNDYELFEASSYGRISNEFVPGSEDTLISTSIGEVIFKGDSIIPVINNEFVLFNDFNINNLNGLKIFSDSINILGNLEFNLGIVDLNGNHIVFYYKKPFMGARTSGVLSNESNTSRIVDSVGTGSVVMVKNLAGGGGDSFYTLGINPKAQLGTGAKIIRYHLPDSMVTDGSINKVYLLAKTTDRDGMSDSLWIHYIDPPPHPRLQRGFTGNSIWNASNNKTNRTKTT